MIYKIDTLLSAFFQAMTNWAGKIRISSNMLVNFFLLILIGFQMTQVVCLRIAKESIFVTLLQAFPTLLVALYFHYMIKRSKKGPVRIDQIRLFALAFCFVVVSYFIYTSILRIFLVPIHENIFYFRSEVAYTAAYIVFPCFLYLLSCTDEKREKKVMLNPGE